MTGTGPLPTGNQSIAMILEKLGRSWPDRAQVRRHPFEAPAFDPGRPDYPESLLPFGAHPLYRDYAPELKQQILTCGWLLYNQKTIAIELDVLTPACTALVHDGASHGLGWEATEVIAQTIVDEAYHALLAVNVCKLASVHRGVTLPRPRLPLLEELARSLAAHESQDGWLIRLAYATVSELFEGDYLRALSSDPTIQPLHREVVAAHERDERAHRKLFPLLLHGLVGQLDEARRRLFVDAAIDAAFAFGACEYEAWAVALDRVGAPYRQRLLAQTREEGASSAVKVDASVLRGALEQLGLAHDQHAAERLGALRAGPRG